MRGPHCSTFILSAEHSSAASPIVGVLSVGFQANAVGIMLRM